MSFLAGLCLGIILGFFGFAYAFKIKERKLKEYLASRPSTKGEWLLKNTKFSVYGKPVSHLISTYPIKFYVRVNR